MAYGELLLGKRYLPAVAAYTLIMLALTAPYWALGQVICPYQPTMATGSQANMRVHETENRKFSDFWRGYIPSVTLQLKGPRSGWLTLWSEFNALGRPAYQIAGFSRAYFLSWVIGLFTASPLIFFTILSLMSCYLAGLFVMLFCRELELSPLAGLLAGTTFATSPVFMYWLTFPMFLAVWCWAAGALWGITRTAKRPDLLGWSVLAFSVYSLLLTAYPQRVVFHVYILGAYAICLAVGVLRRRGGREAGRVVGLWAGAALLGGLAALPVWLDLFDVLRQSARTETASSFFTSVLPHIRGIGDALQFVALSTAPELFGNPVSGTYPFHIYDGLSITAFFVFLLAASAVLRWKRSWGWWLGVLLLGVFTFSRTFYEFGLHYMIFDLSRSLPLVNVMLPLAVIAAFGADALVHQQAGRRRLLAVGCGLLAALLAVAAAMVYGIHFGFPVRWKMAAVMVFIVVLLATQARRVHTVFLLAALLLTVATTAYPLMLRQYRDQITVNSSLTNRIREALPGGSRYAVVGPGVTILPPNFNANIGLRSIHSYDSLSSKRYQDLIKKLGGKVVTYGRWNDSIGKSFDSLWFWMSNIGLVLSKERLDDGNLEFVGEQGGVRMYRVTSRMGRAALVGVRPQMLSRSGVADIHRAAVDGRAPAREIRDEGDLLEYAVTAAAPSVLVVSQIFNSDWKAEVRKGSAWTEADTVAVDGIFQGVVVPSGSTAVRLAFRPYVRFAWIGHVIWACLLALVGFRAWRRSRQLQRV